MAMFAVSQNRRLTLAFESYDDLVESSDAICSALNRLASKYRDSTPGAIFCVLDVAAIPEAGDGV